MQATTTYKNIPLCKMFCGNKTINSQSNYQSLLIFIGSQYVRLDLEFRYNLNHTEILDQGNLQNILNFTNTFLIVAFCIH